MGKFRMRLIAVPLIAAFLLSGCLDNRPKVLGTGKKFDFSSFDTGTQNLFKFNFALLGDTVTRNGRATTTFYMQGSANTKAGMIGTCNLAGTGCVCKYFQADGVTSAGADSGGTSGISYDDRGNYFRCNYVDTTPSGVAFIKLQNLSETIVSAPIPVDTTGTNGTLTIGKLIGTDLDLKRVRHVFRYSCEFSFLQKEGTSTQSFDCTDAQVSCDPDGDIGKNFCLLKSRFPFFLFSDGLSSNFDLKIADRLYNGAGGSGKICGLQIKQINCADSDSTPVVKFGLFGEQTGIWDTSVQLGAGPDLSPVSYGFAARVSAASPFDCPPGLVKRVFYKAGGTTGIVTSDILPTHNFTSLLSATEVDTPTATVSAFTITKFSGAHCNPGQTPTQCQFPASQVLTPVKTVAYDKTGQTEFCVIPSTLLP